MKSTWWKSAAIAGSLAAVLVLAACGSDPTPTPRPTATPVPTPTPAPVPTPTPAPGATTVPTPRPAPGPTPTPTVDPIVAFQPEWGGAHRRSPGGGRAVRGDRRRQRDSKLQADPGSVLGKVWHRGHRLDRRRTGNCGPHSRGAGGGQVHRRHHSQRRQHGEDAVRPERRARAHRAPVGASRGDGPVQLVSAEALVDRPRAEVHLCLLGVRQQLQPRHAL